MTRFRVWAPRPTRVELVLEGEDRPMTPEPGGWWALDVPEAGPGTDYAFRLDGRGPFPDPRSAWQPEGVHGPSRLVDHAAFPWSDAGFEPVPLADAVLYELHVGTFSEAGTFEGAIPHLDHVAALGVTHVELMPVAAFPGARGWGYDGVDLFAPQDAYGGPDGLKRLVDACHARGLAVVLDVVYNHLGPDGNHLGSFGPYFTDRYGTPWGDAVNLDDAGSDEVRRFLVDNAVSWVLDYHVDGLRVDAVHELYDRSAVHLLEELADEVRAAASALGRRAVVIAESDLNDPRLVRPVSRGGYGLDAMWSDDFRHALHVALTGERDRYHAQYDGLPDLALALERGFAFEGRYSSFRDRRHGRPLGDVPLDRLVGFVQNHDQVGNRPYGERISQLVEPPALRLAAALVLLGPFVPLLFAGEEWAATTPFQYFTDHGDPALGEAVREGRRREFAAFVTDTGSVPDPQDPATFARSRLRWPELAEPRHAAMVAWYRELIAARRAHPGLRDGSRPRVTTTDDGILVAQRSGYALAANLGRAPSVAPLDGPVGSLLVASSEAVQATASGLALGPFDVALARSG